MCHRNTLLHHDPTQPVWSAERYLIALDPRPVSVFDFLSYAAEILTRVTGMFPALLSALVLVNIILMLFFMHGLLLLKWLASLIP
jgi:hypothetical protein